MSFGVVVRGPLGAGKTTVARALAGELPGTYVSIDEILERFEWDGGSEALFLRANDIAISTAQAELTRRQPVVLDGNFYWASVLRDLRDRLGAPVHVFTLEVPLAVCIERDRGRPESHGEEGARAVFAKAARVTEGVPVDGTTPVGTTVATILAHLRTAGAS